MKHVSYFLLVLISAAFLGSCSSSKYAGHIRNNDFGKDRSVVKEKVISENQAISRMQEPAAAPLIQTEISSGSVPETGLQASTTSAPVIFSRSVVNEKNVPVGEIKPLVKKAEKKQATKQHLMIHKKYSSAPLIVEVLLAILLPPVAVYLHDGIGTSFWINILLTLLFFLPGVIHALLVVTDTI